MVTNSGPKFVEFPLLGKRPYSDSYDEMAPASETARFLAVTFFAELSALWIAGISSPTKMAIMQITTSSSINVKARGLLRFFHETFKGDFILLLSVS